MNRIEKNKTQTDQAWNKLHNRLETDGLLPTVTERRFATRPTAWIGIAAIVAIISLCVYLPTVLRTDRHLSGGELLVKANKEESILVTTLEDGSVVYLSEQTSLEYPKHFSKKRREVSLKGNALFDIAGNRARPFFIETGKVQIEVIGTAFHVRNSGNSPFELAVQRGEVKVTQKQNGQEIHVKAGETATLLGDEWAVDCDREFRTVYPIHAKYAFQRRTVGSHPACHQPSPDGNTSAKFPGTGETCTDGFVLRGFS